MLMQALQPFRGNTLSRRGEGGFTRVGFWETSKATSQTDTIGGDKKVLSLSEKRDVVSSTSMAMETNGVKSLAAVEQAATERASVLELCGRDAEKCGDDASERVAGATAGWQDVGVAAETAGMVL